MVLTDAVHQQAKSTRSKSALVLEEAQLADAALQRSKLMQIVRLLYFVEFDVRSDARENSSRWLKCRKGRLT